MDFRNSISRNGKNTHDSKYSHTNRWRLAAFSIESRRNAKLRDKAVYCSKWTYGVFDPPSYASCPHSGIRPSHVIDNSGILEHYERGGAWR